MAQYGVAVNECRGEACSADSKAFCDKFKMRFTATFSLALYDPEPALLLSDLWCHRMQWLLDIWLASAKLRTCFDTVDFATYVPPAS